MELDALEVIKAGNTWPRRLVQIAGRMDQNVTRTLHDLARLEVSGLYFPLAFSFIPVRTLDKVGRVDKVTQLVPRDKVLEV